MSLAPSTSPAAFAAAMDGAPALIRGENGAPTLASTGAFPCILYGDEATGILAAAMRQIRAQMVRASGFNPHAGCMAAMLDIGFGRRKDHCFI